MTTSRTAILDAVRLSLGRGPASPEARQAVNQRLSGHPRNLVPARSALPPADRIALFVRMALEVSATVDRLADPASVPQAAAAFLAGHNLPAALRLAPHRALAALPWASQPTLDISAGCARDGDAVSLTAAFAGVAETGSLVLVSGPEHPTTLNFLPDTHIVVLGSDQIVGCYEDAWDRLRAAMPGGLPRTVNFVTGPSRTGDIEQQIQLGAHGPRRLHIIMVESGWPPAGD
jgi:L-lactate dehydrogenase complex protein LldG